MESNSSTSIANRNATEDSGDPGFSCHDIDPGAEGLGTVWFKFEATHHSARIYTCNSLPPASDSMVQVLSVGDPSTPETACDSLEVFACSDDEPGCATGLNSDICVTGLITGETYYVLLASRTDDRRGVYELEIESPCPLFPAVSTNRGHSPTIRKEMGTFRETGSTPGGQTQRPGIWPSSVQRQHREAPDDPPPPSVLVKERAISPAVLVRRGSFTSVQVNVDGEGNNIVGDAAHEPSIAVDSTDPKIIVIGWRQFDSITSNFRQAGWAYSHDGGLTWTFRGVLEPGVFRSDPVLDTDADGNIYYYSLTEDFRCDLFKSVDGGVSWLEGVPAFGGDKAWMAIDRTSGIGRGNIYLGWSGCGGACAFTRSTDAGATFLDPIGGSGFSWGTLSVGAQGELYIVNSLFNVIKSTNARDPRVLPTFDLTRSANLGGFIRHGGDPNPGGLLGQAWVATDHSNGPTRGNVYVLGSVKRSGNDPLDVMFARSTDGGLTWSDPVRVNQDSLGNGAWQWFGTMSVAPNGRIDTVWNDTRNTGAANLSELFYAFSTDGGLTWIERGPVTPVFDSHAGWPSQDKLGDYYDMVSDDDGACVAYAATFGGEQNVFFLRVGDCNANGIRDTRDVDDGTSKDCNENRVPDECEPDFDGDGLINLCDFDMDDDGIPNDVDTCPLTPTGTPTGSDGRPTGDTNENCHLDLNDYWRFRTCLLQGGPGVASPSEICLEVFDYDEDGRIDLADCAEFMNAFTTKR